MQHNLRGARISIIGSRGFPSTYGGFETLVRHLAPALSDMGAQVTVYGRSHDGPRRARHHTGVHTVHTRGLRGASVSTLTHGFTAAAHSAWNGADAVLVLNVANGFYLPVMRAAGIPTAVNVDGIEWLRGKWGRAARATFRTGARLTARYADTIIADAQAIGTYWADHYARESIYIPYGADVLTHTGRDLVEAAGLKPGGYVLAVARLVPENNVDLLLEAGSQLGWEPPIVVVGTGTGRTPLESRLRQLCKEGAGLRWLGHVADQELLNQLWQNCLLYVHGHSVGGTNPALLQALGAGAPTIALDTVYNREVLGGRGATYPPDADVLAQMISNLAADELTRREMGRTNRNIVATRYQWTNVVRDYASVMEALLDRR